MRLFLLLMVFAVPMAFMTNETLGQDSNGVGRRAPLDLPSGGVTAEEEEEDLPETITFYGSEVEGNSFVWCFPAYGFCGIEAPFTAIKNEITSAVNQLTPEAWFGMVGFNVEQPFIWRPSAVRATSANKGSALAWMNGLVAVESHCLLNAGLAALQISQSSPGDGKILVIMGARAPYCSGGSANYAQQCLEQITGANYQNSPINTFYVTSPFYSGESQFYIDLAAQNQGSFTQIDY